jgi:hypothetical protein
MDEERKREILRAARATIARIDSANLEWAQENAARDLYEPLVREKPPRSTKPQPQRNNVMAEQNWDGWNNWARGHVEAGTNMVAQVIGEEVAKIERRLIERITALEVELAVLRGEVKGGVAALPNWRKRDAA